MATPEFPHAQLRVVHHELERQLQENLTLQGNLITRALVSLEPLDYRSDSGTTPDRGVGLRTPVPERLQEQIAKFEAFAAEG